MSILKVHPIPAFTDNYIWCTYNDSTKQALVVDPGDAEPVIQFLSENNYDLVAILVTHHHFDHTQGVSKLVSIYNPKVYANTLTPIKGIMSVDSTKNFSLLNCNFKVIEVPGHTLDHIAFYSEGCEVHPTPWLFCGDTLFSAGCGRLFEGTANQMFNSLGKFSKLPAETAVYCTHEYTESNLKFARHYFPDNNDLLHYSENIKTRRLQNQPSLPSSIALELKINPFLNADNLKWLYDFNQNTKNKTELGLPFFTQLRKLKDQF
jgi:hydroxyacylglutathione hydrolase